MGNTPLQTRVHEHLRERWGNGFNTLLLEEKETIALYWLEGEVMNGGLSQYFSNSSGDLTDYALSGLRRVEATQTLAVFSSAVRKLGAGDRVADGSVRTACLERLDFELDPFDAETRIIQGLPEDFFRRSLDSLAPIYFPSDP